MAMKLKQSLFTTIFALLPGNTPLFAHHASGAPMHPSEGADHPHRLYGAISASPSGTIEALTIKLDESFRVITDARDATGYVKNKAALKAHEANIKALRNGLRHHTLFAGNDEYRCVASGSHLDGAAQCEQQVKSLIHDVAKSFDTFELTNDEPDNPVIIATMDIGPAYAAHQEALKKLAATIAQHEPTLAQVMKSCF
jgi:hypothetical protein